MLDNNNKGNQIAKEFAVTSTATSHRRKDGHIPMIKVLVVAPYPGLAKLVNTIAERYPDYELKVVVGNLEDGLWYSQQAEKEGYSIILSRGGTADYLMEHVDLPVLNIPVSGYDVIRSVALAQNLLGRKVVVGFEAITRGYKTVNMLMHTDMEIITIQNKQEVLPILETLKQQNVTSVIGDVITVDSAKSIGLDGILVTSGEESIQDAFDQIAPYLKHIAPYKRYAMLLERTLLSIPDTGIFVFDAEQKQLFPKDDNVNRDLLRHLNTRVPDVLQKSKISSLYTLPSGICYQLSGQTFTVDDSDSSTQNVVFSLHELEASLSGKQGIHLLDLSKKALAYSLYNTVNDEWHEMIERTRLLAKARAPILLEGEFGVGKRDIGLLLHKDMAGAQAVVICIDCTQIRPDGISTLFEELQHSNRASGKIPLQLEGLHTLSKDCQDRMLTYAAQFRYFQIIATTQRSLEKMVQSGQFSKELYNLLGITVVWIPPLRQHKEDIENLTGVIISQENEKVGKQIVGMQSAALSQFKQYQWPRNIAQLRNILHEAVKITDSPFISLNTILALLASDQRTYSDVIDIGPGRTLEDIERDIIKAVLHDEEMNQTRAAERLGISRTTLWRKIQP